MTRRVIPLRCHPWQEKVPPPIFEGKVLYNDISGGYLFLAEDLKIVLSQHLFKKLADCV